MQIKREDNTVTITFNDGTEKKMTFYTGLQAQVAMERAELAAEEYFNQVKKNK